MGLDTGILFEKTMLDILRKNNLISQTEHERTLELIKSKNISNLNTEERIEKNEFLDKNYKLSKTDCFIGSVVKLPLMNISITITEILDNEEYEGVIVSTKDEKHRIGDKISLNFEELKYGVLVKI